jgi:hypothetical protein
MGIAIGKTCYFCSFPAVVILHGKYSGQNDTTAVRRNTPASNPRTKAVVPDTTPPKYSRAMMLAVPMRRIRSMKPMFFILILHLSIFSFRE